MPIRRLIEEIGGKILPPRTNCFPVGERRQEAATEAPALERRHCISGVGAEGSGRAIRRYLETRREFPPPRDLVVHFDERRAEATIFGIIPDQDTRHLVVAAALRIQGVERVKDRLTLAVMARPV